VKEGRHEGINGSITDGWAMGRVDGGEEELHGGRLIKKEGRTMLMKEGIYVGRTL
jgi:hypothetical protein